MGLSENVVYPIFPMVLLIIIPTKWLFHWGYTPFSDTQKSNSTGAKEVPKTSQDIDGIHELGITRRMTIGRWWMMWSTP
jgi:hypothetical protein